MREYSIYIIRNTENEKVYIGQTCQSVAERFRQHMKPSVHKQRGTYKLYNAIKKYGRDKFYVEVLETGISEHDVDDREKEYIERYDSFQNGYNSTKGGDGKTISKIEDLEKLKKLYVDGYPLDSIAREFGVTQQTISRTVKLLNVPPRLLKVTEEYLIKNKDCKTNVEMAKEIGVDTETITRALKRYGMQRKKGCNNALNRQNQPKLSEDRKEEFIKLWYDTKIPLKQVSQYFGVDLRQLYRYADRWGLLRRRQAIEWINDHGNINIKL